MRALLQGHEKRSTVGSATPDFFSADILHCFSLQHSQLKAHWKKKKKHSLPKETKKGKNKQRNGSSCSEAPTGLSHHEQGGPSHCPPTPSPPSAGGGLEPAVPSLGGRLPGCTEGGGPALRPPPRLQVGTAPRLGTLPSAVPFLGCCPSLVVPPPSAPLLFFFLE